MIKFGLSCDHGHAFEAWFSSSDDFDTQQGRGLVTCPVCNSDKVEKSLMAPAVSTARSREKMAVSNETAMRSKVFAEMRKLRDKITENADNVGREFPEEARRIHYGESEPRGIYGEANKEEVGALLEEGIEIAPLPPVPEDAN